MTTTRFAPSPTGYLHIGNLRAALMNFLIARKSQGEFILRIDDTDTERSKQEFIDSILFDLEWLGLHWDRIEYQSKRLERYLSTAEDLKKIGRFYECFETPTELDSRPQFIDGEGNFGQRLTNNPSDKANQNEIYIDKDIMV